MAQGRVAPVSNGERSHFPTREDIGGLDPVASCGKVWHSLGEEESMMGLGSGSLRMLVACCIALMESGCGSGDSPADGPGTAEASSDARAFVPEGLALE